MITTPTHATNQIPIESMLLLAVLRVRADPAVRSAELSGGPAGGPGVVGRTGQQGVEMVRS